MAVTVIGFRVDESGTAVSIDDSGVVRDLLRRGWFPSKPPTTAERADLRAWSIDRLAEVHAWEARMQQVDTAEDAEVDSAFLAWVAANKTAALVRRLLKSLLALYRARVS